MSLYTVSQLNFSVSSTANDIFTIVPTASRIIQLIEFSVSGMATASSASCINIYAITTAGTTGTSPLTPQPLNPAYAPASTVTVSTAWTGQPTIGTQPLVPLAVNGNGGVYRWVARPDEVVLAIGGVAAALGWSVRASTAPTQPYTISCTWSENPF
jgi:hypothetical protein